MSTVRSFGRLWTAIFAAIFACAIALAVTPAHAAEGDEGTDVIDVIDFDSGVMALDEDSDASDGQGPGETSGDANVTQPGSGDAGDQGQTSNPGTTQTPSDQPAGDKGNGQDTTGQDTPQPPAQPAEPQPTYEETHTNMYRLYNPNSGEHFYTMDYHEATNVAGAGWQWEGIGWVSPLTGTPVYRLYNPNAGDHHYTTDAAERDTLVRLGWSNEGIGWYSDSPEHTVVLRQYNPNAVAGAHNFTTSTDENASLVAAGWNHEGLAWYATNGPTLAVKARWLVTNAWGSLERYWIGTDGNIAKNRIVEAGEGAGYTAYAKYDGAVVRGKYDTGNCYVYVADQDGRLMATDDGEDGWVVTDLYDGGMQRYYYSKANHAALNGFFTIGDKPYYAVPHEGYVMRGKFTWVGVVLLSNVESGVLFTADGWVVTNDFDIEPQRYYFVQALDRYTGAKIELFEVDGNLYYGDTKQGFVHRNKYVYAADRWYTADNDGLLTESAMGPEEGAMWLRAQGFWSPTDTLVLVDTDLCRVGIFKGSEGNWNLDTFIPCVCGAPWSPTITGTYSLGYHLPVLPAWSNALYCTNIVGGYFFHSVLGSTSELGQHLSHGCIRLDWPMAQYMQAQPYGSTVNLY